MFDYMANMGHNIVHSGNYDCYCAIFFSRKTNFSIRTFSTVNEVYFGSIALPHLAIKWQARTMCSTEIGAHQSAVAGTS
jgi:hypothetical protein